MATNVIRIKPYVYIHVHDNNTNITRVEVGHQTFTRQEHEKVVFGPEEMIKIPPRNYLVISNPIERNDKNEPIFDKSGAPKLRFGDEEIRFEDTIKEAFPLYPGESLVGKINPLPYVEANKALLLRAERDCKDHKGVERKAGSEWLFYGPATYYPQVAVKVVENISAIIIKQNQALRLKAKRQTTDKSGKKRIPGETWQIRETGAYIPEVNEEIVEVDGKQLINATVLTEKKAIQLRASKNFTDIYKKDRKAGEQWLVTFEESSTHILDVHEEFVKDVQLTTLSDREYCVVIDAVGADGKNRPGFEQLRVGKVSFFLQPGERLKSGVQVVRILSEGEALLLKSNSGVTEKATDKKTGKVTEIVRRPGETWMIYGPTDYVPPVEVEVVEVRKRIPLDENEGIYVRDLKTGKVRSVFGQSYMLQPHEVLWEKSLPALVETLLGKAGRERSNRWKAESASSGSRDKTRVVSYRAPHNSAVQIYDYSNKKSRIVFGPELINLGPDEHFSTMSLSGGVPKRPSRIDTVCLLLGPDFMTDVVIVETSDHARLSIQLSYNWQFELNKENGEEAAKLFAVFDFVGAACKAIASRVRGSVATKTFDQFHKSSSDIIRTAVFGAEKGVTRTKLHFATNNLVITAVDIQSVEPVDERTRDSLQKSVQLAIEITTKSQEATARHEAERIEQEAKGTLQIQMIKSQIESEKERTELLSLQAKSSTVEATGQAIAEARARADALEIEAKAAVEQARLRSR
eukprot:TRINITY_DN477_c0_g2_i1.p1 TRINITY_DN477_c0_g2~~TRINITY_DN477_c0_g2_i1.p1  ORF type:complete len:769 (-),score=337.33 TRINITY_DN477_c0_g2_i1:450-2687(-)